MADEATTILIEEPEDLGNPVPVILGFVITAVVLFFAVNIALYYYAQSNAPAKKQKKVGIKKMKRETLKQGIRVLGD